MGTLYSSLKGRPQPALPALLLLWHQLPLGTPLRCTDSLRAAKHTALHSTARHGAAQHRAAQPSLTRVPPETVGPVHASCHACPAGPAPGWPPWQPGKHRRPCAAAPPRGRGACSKVGEGARQGALVKMVGTSRAYRCAVRRKFSRRRGRAQPLVQTSCAAARFRRASLSQCLSQRTVA